MLQSERDMMHLTCGDCAMCRIQPNKKFRTTCPKANPNDKVCAGFTPKEDKEDTEERG